MNHLIEFVEGNLHLINTSEKVSAFIRADGTWDTSRWTHCLPNWVIQVVSQVKPQMRTGEDVTCWRRSSDGGFSVKSAYNMINDETDVSRGTGWKQLWKMKIPEKVTFFLWQVYQERLPTNLLKARRGLNTSAECPFECQREETIIHILRDCEVARNVWIKLIHANNRLSFFSSPLQVWLKDNMEKEVSFGKIRRFTWSKAFSLICWGLWRNRCSGAIEGV